MTAGLSRYAGLAAIAVLWGTLGTAAVRGGFPVLGEKPISWMVADPATSALFRVGLAVGAVLLMAFHRHLRGRYRVGRGFSVIMLGGLVGQLIAAAVPIDGAAAEVHTAAALALGLSLPALMWRFAVAQPPGPHRRLAFGLLGLELAACAAGILLSQRSVAPLAEILPAAAFHLWIVAFTLTATTRVPISAVSGTQKWALAR